MIYADSGIVTKWYLPEADSEAAVALRDRYSPPAILTSLHRLELANAWRLKMFRQELSEAAFQMARASLLDDIHAGLWYCPAEPLVEAYSRAEALALAHSAEIGTRSLDMLHVAMAEVLECSHFLTGDQRQARLARAVKLPLVFHQPS
jgi:predicted nucleic acid-binding protein